VLNQHSAPHPFRRLDAAARQVCLPTDTEEECQRCYPWLRQRRGPRVDSRPRHPCGEATRKASRVRAERSPRDHLHSGVGLKVHSGVWQCLIYRLYFALNSMYGGLFCPKSATSDGLNREQALFALSAAVSPGTTGSSQKPLGGQPDELSSETRRGPSTLCTG